MKIICPICPQSFEEFKNLVTKIDNRADIIEVWIDEISSDFFEKFKVLKKDVKFLAVCKQVQEKGQFKGTSEERVEYLNKFLKSGGDFVDVDIMQNKKAEIKKINPQKLILSFHDFNGLSNLDSIFEKMLELDPAIYKFAVTVNNMKDLDKFIKFVDKFPSDKKAVFTTMGEYGKIGRQKIGKKSWGQFFALDATLKTASGQMTLDDLG